MHGFQEFLLGLKFGFPLAVSCAACLSAISPLQMSDRTNACAPPLSPVPPFLLPFLSGVPSPSLPLCLLCVPHIFLLDSSSVTVRQALMTHLKGDSKLCEVSDLHIIKM